jgi:hypothetical protein
MAECTILKNIETVSIDRQCRCFKAKVLGDHKADNSESLENAVDDD